MCESIWGRGNEPVGSAGDSDGMDREVSHGDKRVNQLRYVSVQYKRYGAVALDSAFSDILIVTCSINGRLDRPFKVHRDGRIDAAS
jgi:hypothetical protein